MEKPTKIVVDNMSTCGVVLVILGITLAVLLILWIAGS